MHDAHNSPIKRFNNWLGLKITSGVGTMWCAYLFTVLALISLPGALSTHDPVVIVAWVAQTFIQLVLLPIIMVGQTLLSKKHQELSAKHDALIKTVNEIHAQVVPANR